MLVAAVIALAVNSLAEVLIFALHGGEAASAVTAVLVAPVVEETAKAAGVVVVLLARRRHIDGVLDGLVCAGFVGVGFAFTENILYFGRAYAQAEELGISPAAATVAAFVARGVASPFAHPLFTALTGLAIGWAATTARPALLRLAVALLGLAGAIVLHAFWNLSAVAAGGAGLVGAYVLFMVPAFLVVAGIAIGLHRRERHVFARALPVYVTGGWIPPYDIDMLASLPGRGQARSWAEAQLGSRGERAMRDYQQAVGELAFLRDRANRLGVDRYFADRELHLLAALR